MDKEQFDELRDLCDAGAKALVILASFIKSEDSKQELTINDKEGREWKVTMHAVLQDSMGSGRDE